jgi:CspA family cold shock protein
MEVAEALLQSITKEPRQKGFVRWFDNSKGYGFIQRRQGEADIFVHHSAIQMKGYRTLIENQPVEFDLEVSAKGLIAINVVPQQ